MKAKIQGGILIIEELSDSDHDADWIKELPGYHKGEDAAHKYAAKLEKERRKRDKGKRKKK